MKIDEVIREAGSAGMTSRALYRKPDTEDIIRGYFRTDDVGYGLRMLISHFEHQKQAQPFKVGDRVKVRKRFWYLGWQNDGWHGYAPMFADAHGTVKEVGWSTPQASWYVMVRYENPYYYTTWREGTFFVKDDPSHFMFFIEHVKRVK